MTASSPFEAKVVAARLGSEGVLCQLRGGVDSIYPLGSVVVMVPASELDTAREVLMVGDSELDLTAPDGPSPGDDGADVGASRPPLEPPGGVDVAMRPWIQHPLWRIAAVAAVAAMLAAAARSLLAVAS
jgi:hypothetical protein